MLIVYLNYARGLLYDAVLVNAPKIAQVLINNGADVNALGRNDLTPLLLAVLMGRKAAFDSLMAAKPDLTCEDDDGNTALNYAQVSDEDSGPAMLKALTDANAPTGDRRQTIYSQDRMLVAHVTSFNVDSDTGIAKITGIVSNLGTQHYSYVEINAKFTDGLGTLVDTSLDNVESLDAHENWEFSITTLKDGVSEYHLASLIARK